MGTLSDVIKQSWPFDFTKELFLISESFASSSVFVRATETGHVGSEVWIRFSATLIRGRSWLGEPLGAAREETTQNENGAILIGALVGAAALAVVMGVIVFSARRLKPPETTQSEDPQSSDDTPSPALRREVMLVDFFTGKTVSTLDVASDFEELESST
jgi:hypothetical protein